MSDLYLPQVDDSGFTSALFINVPKFGSKCSTPIREKEDLNFSHLSNSSYSNQGNSDKKQDDTSVRCWLSKDLLNRLDMDNHNPTNENSLDDFVTSNCKQESMIDEFCNETSGIFDKNFNNSNSTFPESTNANVNKLIELGNLRQVKKIYNNIDIARQLNFEDNSPMRRNLNTNGFFARIQPMNGFNCPPLFSMCNNFIKPVSNGWNCNFCNFFNFDCKIVKIK
jgi:hypothetical protein